MFDLVRELNRRIEARALSTADAARALELLRDLDRVLGVLPERRTGLDAGAAGAAGRARRRSSGARLGGVRPTARRARGARHRRRGHARWPALAPAGRGGPWLTDRRTTAAVAPGRVVTARVVTGPARTDRAAMARRVSGVEHLAAVRGLAAREADPGTTARARSTVRGVTDPDATDPRPMARGGSSLGPLDRAAQTIAGAPRGHRPTAAGRVGRVGGARVPVPIEGALGPTVVVRGPDRAIDLDRVRGRGRGRTGALTTAVTSPATNRGARTIGRPDLAEASETGPAGSRATPVGRPTGSARGPSRPAPVRRSTGP